MVKLNHGVGTLPLSFSAFQKNIRQSGAVVQAQAAKRVEGAEELVGWPSVRVDLPLVI